MFKQVMVILLLSVVVIFFKNQLAHVLDWLVAAHNYFAQKLHFIFSNDRIGRIIQDLIALLIIPILCGFLVLAIGWIIKRGAMPHVMVVVWTVWLVLLVTMVAQNNSGTTFATRTTPHGHVHTSRFSMR